jgi:hypothetical protein
LAPQSAHRFSRFVIMPSPQQFSGRRRAVRAAEEAHHRAVSARKKDRESVAFRDWKCMRALAGALHAQSNIPAKVMKIMRNGYTPDLKPDITDRPHCDCPRARMLCRILRAQAQLPGWRRLRLCLYSEF